MTIHYGITLFSLLTAASLAADLGAPPVATADPAPDLSAATAAIAAAIDSAAGAAIAPAPSAVRTPLAGSSARRVDYLWVVRSTLASPAKIQHAIESAHAMGVKGLLAQVVGRGDAYYRSDLLPRAAALTAADFDPLGELVARAHAAGLEVHAWVNCMLVWSEPGRPRDPRHVVNAHPDWVARLADGRPMSALSARQRRRLGVEGVFLSPAHPGVRAWLGSIAKEIAGRYAVDGVHLDYIRRPGVRLDADPGACPASPCDQVAAVVCEVRDSLAAARPGLALSAAVVADTAAAERAHAQRWTAWLRQGLIDRAFVMCYAPALQTVTDQLLGYAASLGTGGRVVPGIAVYNTRPAAAAAKIKAARALGYPELALYSYDALAEQPDYWRRLSADLDGARGGERSLGGIP